MEYICTWLVLRWLLVIIDVRIVSYNRHSSILFKLHVIIIIGCIHIRIHGCIQLCIHIYCSQVHRCHSIIVNRQLSSLKLKKKKIGLTLMETIDEWGSQQFPKKLHCCIGGGEGSEIEQVDW